MAGETVPQSYDGAQRAFHWIMAALIFLAIAIGVVVTWLPARTSPRVELLMLHKSLGMTVLVLAVLRVGYRLMAGEPPYGETLAPLMRAAAHVAHFALYVLMIAMPVSGYIDWRRAAMTCRGSACSPGPWSRRETKRSRIGARRRIIGLPGPSARRSCCIWGRPPGISG